MIKAIHLIRYACFFVIINFLFCLTSVDAQNDIKERIGENQNEKKQNTSVNTGNEDHHFSLEHEGINRKYNVHLPADYNKNRAMPVVIYLHGGGGSLRAAYQDRVDQAADKFGFILVIPNGTGPIPDRLLTWNGGKWGSDECCGYASDHNIDDLGFMAKMIEEVEAKFNVDQKKIYATGISNGGLMSYRLACELSDKIAAIAPVAPPATPAECSPSRPVSVMHIHGTADPCAPVNGGTTGKCIGIRTFMAQSASTMIGFWQQRNKCSTILETVYQKGKAVCKKPAACQDGSDVELCTVEGMGHTWPSGWQYFPAERVGPVSYDLSFDQIWEFFKNHPIK
jgi:polyhydroxybutyrate depolymerase